MKSIRVLDCTLRDGGLVDGVNCWFGRGVLNSIYQRLDAARIDIIEVGFLDDKKTFSIDKTEVPHSRDFEKLIKFKEKRNAMVVGMCMLPVVSEKMIDNIEDKSKCILDAIRVVFQKHQIDYAYDFCKKLIAKGYKIFIQPAMINKYSPEEAAAMVKKFNSLKPYAISMVDTYGLMHRKDLFDMYDVFAKNSSPQVAIGYHSHNNFQLAYANAIELMQYCKDRDLIIDTSVYGMGKRSGNAHTELVAAFLNRNYGTNYDVGQILEIIDLEILALHEKYRWGYSLVDFIAASHDRYYGYVEYLLKKKVLSMNAIHEIILKIPEEKKTAFDKELIEKLFFEYQNNIVNDTEAYAGLAAKIKDKNILILAPGPSLVKQEKKIQDYIAKNKPVVFAINLVPETYKPNYVFVSNSRRYNQLIYDLLERNSAKLIVTSNITSADKAPKIVFNFAKLRIDVEDISDNAALLLMEILETAGVEKVAIAGFDGFEEGKDNYSGGYNALCEINNAQGHNEKIIKYLKNNNKLKLDFLTESKYK